MRTKTPADVSYGATHGAFGLHSRDLRYPYIMHRQSLRHVEERKRIREKRGVEHMMTTLKRGLGWSLM